MAETITAPAANKSVKRKKLIKKCLIIAIVLLLVAGAVFALFRFLTGQKESASTIQSHFVSVGSIESRVTGSGNAGAKETAAITLTASGTVQEVLVTSGSTVTAGQPLYTIFSQDAQDQATKARDELKKVREDLDFLRQDAEHLTITAPFAGKLIDVKTFELEQELTRGTPVATLVNDRQLKLSVYFSYAFEQDIAVGQAVQVSVPAVMRTFQGTVDQIHKVNFITPEGAMHFEVVVVFDNPGTLTAGMDASVSLTDRDGFAIYPYKSGVTEYYETRTIETKAAGPVLGWENLRNHANVSAGEALLYLGSDTIDRDIRSKQDEVDEAQKRYDEAVKALSDFNAVAPIDGTVTSCTLSQGMAVKSGDTVITISNTSDMVVEITVDDRNIAFIQPGMMVELSDWNANMYMGTVSAINMAGAQSSNGMTRYPVTLEVENTNGSLLAGMWLDYSFVASQSDECLLVPMQSVKYVSDENGETFSVVFVRADEKPEHTVELDIPEALPGQTPKYPSPKDGYYPVPVETGLSDNFNVEIKSGLNEGEEVFVNFYVEQAFA